MTTTFVALSIAAVGCGDGGSAGEGTLKLTIWGDAFAESALPASQTDGWTITFDRFLLHLGRVEVAGGDGNSWSTDVSAVFDIAQPSNNQGHTVGEFAAPAGSYDSLSFQIVKSSQSPGGGNATTDDVRVMAAGRHAVYVEGTAVKGATRKTFRWRFDVDKTYQGCQTALVLEPGMLAVSQLTIAVDRLFWDTLQGQSQRGTFEAIANADADGDGEITRSELEAVPMSTLTTYSTGSRTDVTTLWQFLGERSAAVGLGDAGGCT